MTARYSGGWLRLAKLTPERAWLAEVPSVALMQACNDARRAYRNWFNSLSGRRKGRKIGHPVFRRKRGRQSARLTRNGFACMASGCMWRKSATSGSAGPDHCHRNRLVSP